MTRANDPALRSWVDVAPDSDFPIQNLPFGIGERDGDRPRPVVAIGDQALDLAVLQHAGLLDVPGLRADVLHQPVLNELIALGKKVTGPLRDRLADLLRHENDELRDSDVRGRALIPQRELTMRLPVRIGDYTDFYSSIDHATNVGTMFRDPNNALLPNWKHLPVGYHGRASSIVVSGTPIRRPKGQQMPEGADAPVFGPTRLLDFELEVAFITGKATELGESVSTAEAEHHIFGLVLFNDLSARDIQKWEYVPLGPFLAKNFGSVISPWIVTLEALEPFRVEGYPQDPPVLPYLAYEGRKNYDLRLEVDLVPPGGEALTVCRSNFRYLYWNMCQQLAHQTVNGCNLNVGDCYASGTISGPEPGSFGSMLELTWRGTKPLRMPDGTERKFIGDGDEVVLRGWGQADGYRIGFGESRCAILPAD
jgi:fumarylacetoacetase